MKPLTKNLILFVSIILSFGQFIHAQQNEPPDRKLEFITSEEYEELDSTIKSYIGDHLPTHVAIFRFLTNSPGGFMMSIKDNMNITRIDSPFSSGRGGRGDFYLYHCIIKDDTSSNNLEFMFFNQSRSSSNGSQIYYILANSAQQARQFTEAFIKSYDNDTYTNLKQLKDELESYRKIVREGETVISKMEAECKELEEQKNKLYKEYAKANYLSQDNIPDINDMVRDELRRGPSVEDENIPGINNIVKVKEELAHSLREVDFELIGLDAKIESINKYKLSGTIIDDETLIKLNQILMATDIERAGVLARKQAFETSFKQTTQLYNLILNSKKALVDLEKYKSKFKTAPQIVSQREIMFNNPRDMYQYIQIEDNKVTIKLVKQE